MVGNASGGPNPISKTDGEREVADLYQVFGIGAAQNIAYAEVNVDRFQGELVGVSGKNSPAGTVPTPILRLFDTFETPPGMHRGNDAEAKLLEAVARAIQPDVQKRQWYASPNGTVRLYSHFTICASCEGLIAAFTAMFPAVEFSYSDGT